MNLCNEKNNQFVFKNLDELYSRFFPLNSVINVEFEAHEKDSELGSAFHNIFEGYKKDIDLLNFEIFGAEKKVDMNAVAEIMAGLMQSAYALNIRFQTTQSVSNQYSNTFDQYGIEAYVPTSFKILFQDIPECLESMGAFLLPSKPLSISIFEDSQITVIEKFVLENLR